MLNLVNVVVMSGKSNQPVKTERKRMEPISNGPIVKACAVRCLLSARASALRDRRQNGRNNQGSISISLTGTVGSKNRVGTDPQLEETRKIILDREQGDGEDHDVMLRYLLG